MIYLPLLVFSITRISTLLVRSNCWVHPVQLFTELNGRIMAEIVGIGGDEKEGKKFRKEKFDNNISNIIFAD